MKNLIQCSKYSFKRREYMYPVLLLTPRIIKIVCDSQNYYTSTIKYISIVLVIFAILYDYLFRCKKVDINVDANKLLEEYKYDRS